MTISRAPSAFSLRHLAKLAHPATSRNWRLHRLGFALRGSLYRRSLATVWTAFQPPELQALPVKEPTLLGKIMRPYLHARATPEQSARMLAGHYHFLHQHFPEQIAPIYLDGGMTLGCFPVADEQGQEWRILLRYEPRFRREGELAISIVDAQARRWYTCAFSIIPHQSGHALAIGVMQGPSSVPAEMAKEQIRQLTRMGYGLRPRQLMLELVMQLAQQWQLQHVLAITRGSHVFCSRYYRHKKQGKIKIDYDELWQEWPHQPFDDSFIELLPSEHKPLDEIPSRKRAMYRRRYEWLDSLSGELRQLFSRSSTQMHSATE